MATNVVLNAERLCVMGPLVSRNDILLGISVEADPALTSETATTPPPPPFCRLHPRETLDASCVRLRILPHLSFAAMQEELDRQLVGTTFEGGGRRLEIEGVELRASGRSTLVGLRTTGDFDGTFWLTGCFEYDEDLYRLSVKNLDLEIRSKRRLDFLLSWLAEVSLIEEIRARSTWDLAPQIDPIREGLSSVLNEATGEDWMVERLYPYAFRTVERETQDGDSIPGLEIGLELVLVCDSAGRAAPVRGGNGDA